MPTITSALDGPVRTRITATLPGPAAGLSAKLNSPAVARSTALRAADGVVAGYIHSLARLAAAPDARATPATSGARATPAPATATPNRPPAATYRCGAERGRGLAARRRPALRRVPAPA